MTKTLIRILGGMAMAILAFHANAQGVSLSLEEYNTRKVAGTLPAEFHVEYTTLPVAPQPLESKGKPSHGGQPKGGGNGLCNCWIEPDANYTLAMVPNDDQSSGLITLPFSFNLYGDLYNSCYINNNGNISFGTPYGTFSSSGFPSANFVMVAPFWADVDTRPTDGGTVKYLITNTALYVNWTDVGYFSMMTDKLNTFQLIITDGTDPVIGVGNNVSFCYKNMDWTTGSASGGVNGFGGTPSTVGANRGNGVDFIQFTRNDHAGADYDGPFGNSDGIDWLDFQNFRFTTAVSTQNIPPITSSNFLCDTVEVCMGELVNFNVTFLTPEENQVIIDATATAPTIDNFNYTINNSGTSVTINVQFIPQIADTGFHVVTFTAQDNGADSLISTVTIVLAVYYTPDPPPTIEGNAEACEGVGSVISASPGYENYYWSNGFNGPTILVGPGTYYCLATSGNCRLASNFITVTEIPNPEPDITGPLFSCGGLPVTLGVNNAFDAYQWSNGSTDPNITVGTGQYVVTVTDTNGCVGTATPVNVLTANDPAAFFQSSDASTVFPGTTVTYTDQSSVQGSTITSYAWAINGEPAGNSTTLVSPWDTPGTYVVTLTVTSADGCTNTYSYTQIVIPTEIEIPNVFSPNGDNQNDALVFPGVEYYPNTSLRVFNRWGQAIYESTNYKNNWRAPDVAEGTYFFVLKLANGKDYSGHVTLLR
jgi:gliding motility-associated-like protein